KEWKIKAVKLNYEKMSGGNIALLLLLSDGDVSIESFLQSGQLTSTRLHYILENLKSAYIELMLPRFKLSMAHELVKPLKGLGLNDIFELGSANFANISPQAAQEGLCVSNILQSVVFEVDEQGTKA